MKVLLLGSNEKKITEKYLNKIEASFAKEKWKINSLKIRLLKC